VVQDARHAPHLEQPRVDDSRLLRFVVSRGHAHLPVTPPVDAGRATPAAA
jgi:hypothetical protein